MNILKLESPKHFYRVNEFVTTFEADPGKNNAFSHFEDFQNDDLRIAKKEAEEYYLRRYEGLENSKYFLPFASSKDFKLGKNAAFSINLALVEYYNDEDFLEYYLEGESYEDNVEAQIMEELIWKEKGYSVTHD